MRSDDHESRQQQLIYQAYAAMATSLRVMLHSHSLAVQAAETARELLKLLDRPPPVNTRLIDGNPGDHRDADA